MSRRSVKTPRSPRREQRPFRHALTIVLTLSARHTFKFDISPLQNLDDLGIESLPCVGTYSRHRLVKRKCATVLTVRSQRVETINCRQDARSNWNLLARQAVRISRPIPLFMVRSHNWNYRIWKLHSFQNLCAYKRVNLHLFEFFRSELAGLGDDVFRHRKFANVVQ